MAATSVVRVEQVDPSHLPANTPGRVAAPLYVATSTRSYKRSTVEKKPMKYTIFKKEVKKKICKKLEMLDSQGRT